jgi:type I restriction enzyme M protein
MLDQETKRRIDTARDILVGKLPNPQSQVEQITIALIYKFMDDMDKEAMEFGGEATFFTGDYEKFSWTKIFDPKLGGFEMLALYGEAIVKLNQNPSIPQLFRDIFKNAYLPYRDPETLKMFLKIINEFHYDHSEKLGDAFEYLLSVLGSQGDAGQFRTPRHIIDFMVAIMQPKKTESICDPACGTAGFLISAYKHILNENTNKNKGDLLTPDDKKKIINNFVGYDISSEMVRLSLVNLYLHGFTTPKIYEYDSLTSEERWGDYFDIILANPPFMTPKGGIRPHKKFTMQANRSEVLFVDYIMEHINPTTGRAAIIVPEGIIFQSATAYKALRKLLVDKNYLYGVISLPAGLFQPYSGVKTSILLLDKTLAKKTTKILFTKIENDGYSLGSQRKELATSNLPDATNFIKQYNTAIRNSDFSNIDFENLPLDSLVVEKTIIAENEDYNLSADRYKVAIGHKQSKFDLVELSEVCDLYQPQTISASEFKENGEFKVFGANGVIGFYDKYNHEESQVLITCRGATCGTINFSEPKSWITGNAMVAKPIDSRLNKHFLLYLLKATDLSSVITGAAQPQITRASLSPFKIPLPPIEFQQELVTKINQYEKIIVGAKQVTQNYKPQIEINPNWEMVELGKVCDIGDGNYSSKYPKASEFVEEGVPFLTATNLKNGTVVPDGIRYIAKEHHLELTKGHLIKNDLVIVVRGSSTGNNSIVPTEYEGSNLNSQLAYLRVKDNRLESQYLFIVFNSLDVQKVLLNTISGSAQPQLPNNQLLNIKIPLAPIEEQRTIVAQIEKEQQLVNANKELVTIYEQKIKDEINKLWAE